MAKIGYWRYINQTDTLIWSETIHEIYGTDPEKELPEDDVIYAFFDEKSRNKLTEAEITLNTSEVPFDLELKLTNLKNEERWIRNIGEPLYNSKNELVIMINNISMIAFFINIWCLYSYVGILDYTKCLCAIDKSKIMHYFLYLFRYVIISLIFVS